VTKLPAEPLDEARLAASKVLARVELHRSCESTQVLACEIARRADPGPLPLLIAAEEQTAGRGRGTNRWWTGGGSLAFSLLFDAADWGLPREPAPARSLAVALAIVETVQPRVPNVKVGLRWPNDVYASDRKLAGVLVDLLPGGRHVVGIGLNVNNGLAGAPPEVQSRATSLRELTGATWDRTTLLLELVAHMKTTICDAAARPERFAQRFAALCQQLGQQVSVDVAGRMVSGRCGGIATDGALLLETPSGPERIYSGIMPTIDGIRSTAARALPEG
jgi:BirA family biotin operon repressor/biotin-[acetyl-CoA-carboxylase] ligase